MKKLINCLSEDEEVHKSRLIEKNLEKQCKNRNAPCKILEKVKRC